MAPSGFNQRFKGKIAAAALWIGGVAQNGAGSVTAYSTAGTQTLAGSGAYETINASSGVSIFTMGYGPSLGREQVLSIAVSSNVFIKAAAGASFDASTNTVIKSTYAMQVTLVGLSTVSWRIKSVFPPPSTLVGGSGLTLSTTT